MAYEDTARSVLRAGTTPYHDRVDHLFSSLRLDERSGYAAFLLAQAAAHITVERALTLGGVVAFVPDWAARQRSDLLRDDLAQLGLEPPEPAGAIVLEGEAALLGALYVLEGSRLGGTVLKRALPPAFPARFLGGVDSAAWRRLLGILDARLDTEPRRAAAVMAACAVFALFEVSGQRHVTAGLGLPPAR